MHHNPARCPVCQEGLGGFFCILESEHLADIERVKTTKALKAGEAVFERGDSPEGLFCIVEGLVKVEVENEEGRSHILRLAGPGESIGYRALFGRRKYEARAVAHEASTISFIPRSTIDELMVKQPQLSLKFLELLSEDIKRAEDRLCAATDKDSTSRIAETILFLDSNYTPEKPWTRKDIADWAGTTPETVMRQLSQMEKQGLIASEGRRILITDSSSLNQVAHSA